MEEVEEYVLFGKNGKFYQSHFHDFKCSQLGT